MRPPRSINTSLFVPNPEVVHELTMSPLPAEARAFELAASVETLLPGPHGLEWPYPWSQFLCLFGFIPWRGGLATFPAWGGNPRLKTHAAGFLQDEPWTYRTAALTTGLSSFYPQDQIANNWVVARQAFRAARGGDLLATLRAGGADQVHPAMVSTWPEGCDANFPQRYSQALALFPGPSAGTPAVKI